MDETRRKLVHISGFIFIVLAQLTGKWFAAIYCLMISATLLMYSEHVRLESKRFSGIVKRFEEDVRKRIMNLERPDAARPFIGAFWMFFGFFLAFALFPLNVASAACAMLAIGDGMSTLAGEKYGRHKIIGNKSWQGSLTMFVFSFLSACLFINPVFALVGALAATLVEILPDASFLQKHKKLGFVDDNLLVPLVAGAVMLALSLI